MNSRTFFSCSLSALLILVAVVIQVFFYPYSFKSVSFFKILSSSPLLLFSIMLSIGIGFITFYFLKLKEEKLNSNIARAELREELKRKSVWAEGIKQELERNIAKRIGIERQLSELYLKLAEKEQVELPNSFATQVLGALKRSSFGVGHSAKDIQKTINNIQAKMGALLEKEKKKSTLGPMFQMDFESLETHIAFVRLETQKIRNLLKALDKDLDDKTKISNIIDYEKRTMH